jgi:undecaprenyl diphosphate synthase
LNSKSLTDVPHPLDPAKLPTHIAIIMDGNGRWAKKKLLTRVKGHEQGAETVRMVVRTCRELGIPMLTLYAFSTENWQRPESEITALMLLLKRFLKSEREEMMQRGIRLKAIGQTEKLPQDVQRVLNDTMTLTEGNRAMTLNLALSYGSRAEIVQGVRQIAQKVARQTLDPAQIDANTIADHLYTRGMADPDLLIRTSGEMRISNFLLWQIAYTELYVTATLWPDFSRDELIQILQAYQQRDRRFGRVEA